MRLDNRIAIITGGGSGLGRAMCLEFARQGSVAVVADIDMTGAKETADLIEKEGGHALSIELDVTNIPMIENMIQTVVNRYGRIDILVNNAGIGGELVLAAEASEEVWENVLMTNVTSYFLISKRVIPVMLKAGKGVIINNASGAGLIASKTGVAYTTSKHAVIGLTKQLSFDYGQMGIRVNAICPGATATPKLKESGLLQDGGPFHDLTIQAPAGRYGEPSEVAKATVFLASDDASFIHGIALPVEGGSVIR